MRCTGHWMRCQHEIRNWEPAWSSGLLNFGEKCGAIRNCQCQPADKGRAGAASSLGNSRLVTDKVENTRGHGSRCRHAASDWISFSLVIKCLSPRSFVCWNGVGRSGVSTFGSFQTQVPSRVLHHFPCSLFRVLQSPGDAGGSPVQLVPELSC